MSMVFFSTYPSVQWPGCEDLENSFLNLASALGNTKSILFVFILMCRKCYLKVCTLQGLDPD